MDSIADMLSMIKNAQMAGKESIELPYSKIKEEIAKILEKEGYILKVKRLKEKGKSYKTLHLDLKYKEDGKPAISGLKRVSKLGLRVYKTKKKLPRVLSGYGRAILSTSKGLMTAREARKKNLGGEVICEVW